jgi:hypothetical protein
MRMRHSRVLQYMNKIMRTEMMMGVEGLRATRRNRYVTDESMNARRGDDARERGPWAGW